MYYNNVQRKLTKYKFRFKTEDEFLSIFGDDWKSTILCKWNSDGYMDHLYGIDFTVDFEKDYDINEFYSQNFYDSKRERYWNISRDMIIENNNNTYKCLYDNKKMIYE